MAYSLPNGSTIYLGTTLGTATNVTAITNAAPAVATVASATGLAADDYVLITSGWGRLNERVFKLSDVTGSDVELVDTDTSSTSRYPAGAGTGTLREVSTWVQIQQVLESTSNGGEQQFLEFGFLEDDFERRIPTTKSAAGLTLSIADDTTLPGFDALVAANDARTPYPLRIDLASGAQILYYAYVSVNKTPTLTRNQLMALEVTFSFSGEPSRVPA